MAEDFYVAGGEGAQANFGPIFTMHRHFTSITKSNGTRHGVPVPLRHVPRFLGKEVLHREMQIAETIVKLTFTSAAPWYAAPGPNACTRNGAGPSGRPPHICVLLSVTILDAIRHVF